MVQAAFLVRLNEQHSAQRSVYYVDNHMRPYTGKFTVRKGWRMQDKRARPGVSDYWVHDEDGRPVMRIIGTSSAHAEDLIQYILGRWARQENQFKYGVERWGINQLDGRQVEPYPPDAVIPNPARARLDRALRLARSAEGEALRQLERLPADAPKRIKYQQDLERARAQQQELEAIRPSVPKKAAVEDTELSGKLVKHRRQYKSLLDTLRIALANAESELAARLAPYLPRATEVKKTLENLLVAPGSVRLNKSSITITLSPACNLTERSAFEAFLDEINQLSLNLPGDHQGRRLSFTLENS
jgi:hypothetical protein